MALEGKVAIVTGGARGIGQAVVTALAQHGCKVAFTYFHSAEAAHAVADAWPGQVCAQRHDVGDFSGTQGVVSTVYEVFGGVDILVNNAGILVNKPLYGMSEQEWDTVIDTNLKGVFNFTRTVLPAMMHKRWGRVVNIA